MSSEYALTFSDYLSIIRSRAIYLIVIFAVVLTLSIIVAFSITPMYRSIGTVMVESPQLSQDLAANQNSLEDQISVIGQRVMTRENLLQIADKYNIAKEYVVNLTEAQLLDKLKDRIVIETVSPLGSSSSKQRANSFTISFDDKKPQVSLDVTNDLISMFLDLNIKIRTEGAQETTDFLTQQANKLKAEVDRREKLISAFKQQNKNALPEQLTLRMTMLSRAENDLREVERDIRSTQEDIRSLEVERVASKNSKNDGVGSKSSQSPQTLPELKAELARLSAIYNDAYPDIKIIKRKIEKMEKESGSSGTNDAQVNDPVVFAIQSKIDADNMRLKSLEQQKDMLKRTIGENESSMIETPKVEQGLDVLIRERDSAQKKYEEILNKKMNAQISQSMESENKSERFSLLEPPILPEKPFKPNRPKIILFGFFLALISSGGAIMALESIDQRIRGVESLSNILGVSPLVSIPYITTLQQTSRNKRLLKIWISAILLLFIIILVAVNYMYMPLGTILIKLLARLM